MDQRDFPLEGRDGHACPCSLSNSYTLDVVRLFGRGWRRSCHIPILDVAIFPCVGCSQQALFYKSALYLCNLLCTGRVSHRLTPHIHCSSGECHLRILFHIPFRFILNILLWCQRGTIVVRCEVFTNTRYQYVS